MVGLGVSFGFVRPGLAPTHPSDAAILLTPDQAPVAIASGFAAAVSVGDSFDQEIAIPNTISIPGRYGYLSDGDILGYQPLSCRFRTLYRRSSSHNSFLVTERCNHYCLMCSQPPRDVDDRWLLDEIGAALDLVDPQTKSFAFTGG